MARTLKILAVVVAIVAVLTLAVGGTVYALEAGRCGSGDSVCGQGHRAGCHGSGNRCVEPHECAGSYHCNTDGS